MEILYVNCILKDVLVDYMKNHFGEKAFSEFQMSLFIYQKSGPRKLKRRDIRKISYRLKKDKFTTYAALSNNICDSRLTSSETGKKIVWLLLGTKKSKSLHILAYILLNELVPKFRDMLILDDIIRYKTPSELIQSKKGDFYLRNLADRDWLLKSYIQKVISQYHLPDAQILIELSAMTYEKRKTNSKIYFSKFDIDDCTDNICFALDGNSPNKVELKTDNLRAVRKMMEMAGEGHGLWVRTSDYLIQGIVKDSSEKANQVVVTFHDQLIWSISLGKEMIVKYCHGKYRIPVIEPDNDNAFQINKIDELETHNVEKKKIDKIKNLLHNIEQHCQHGTAIVFMEKSGAEEDAIKEEIENRLEKYKKAYRMKPFPLNDISPSALKNIISIDGAIFSDLDCKCYATGVIVDGKARTIGDPGRGARYNSLVNYIREYYDTHMDTICFVVIFSEDGMVNVVFPEEVIVVAEN